MEWGSKAVLDSEVRGYIAKEGCFKESPECQPGQATEIEYKSSEVGMCKAVLRNSMRPLS